MYKVEYKYGQKYSLAANEIAVEILAQFDEEINRHVLFQEIVYHRYGGTEEKEQDVPLTISTGTKRRRETFLGVEVLVQWKD